MTERKKIRQNKLRLVLYNFCIPQRSLPILNPKRDKHSPKNDDDHHQNALKTTIKQLNPITKKMISLFLMLFAAHLFGLQLS